MGQITTTQNLVAIKEVRHTGQSALQRHSRMAMCLMGGKRSTRDVTTCQISKHLINRDRVMIH